MIVLTHSDGLVRLYRLANDELAQVGQLTAADTVDPVVLATMAGDLAVALHWDPTPNGKPPAGTRDVIIRLPLPAGTGKTKPKPKRKPPRKTAAAGAPLTRKKPAKKAPPKKAPPKMPLGDYRSKPRASRDEIDRRKDTILAALAASGPTSAGDLGEVVFPGQNREQAESRVRKLIDRMVRDRLLVRIPSGSRTVASTFDIANH